MSQVGRYTPGTGAAPVETITGNSGGPVGPSASGNINLLGLTTTGVSVAGNPATNTLTISNADATETQKGVVELATNAEAITGTASTNLAIIPSSLTAKLGTQTANGVAYGQGSTSALGWTSAGTNGQVLIAATGAAPAFASLTSTGGTITFTPGANSLNLEATPGSAILWNNVTGTTQAMAANNGYIANNAGLVTFTLPAVVSVGSRMAIAGNGAGGWTIAQNAGQQMHLLGSSTTAGVGGSLSSTTRYDCLEMICTVANNEFVIRSVMGNITVV